MAITFVIATNAHTKRRGLWLLKKRAVLGTTFAKLFLPSNYLIFDCWRQVWIVQIILSNIFVFYLIKFIWPVTNDILDQGAIGLVVGKRHQHYLISENILLRNIRVTRLRYYGDRGLFRWPIRPSATDRQSVWSPFRSWLYFLS